MSRAFQDHQIRQYLLGDMPAEVENELEAAYFRDSELLSRLELARDDLADDYAAKRLSDDDRQKFERRLLASDEGREQLAIAKALQVSAVDAQKPQSVAWHIDRRWLSLAAMVPIAVAVLIAWRVLSGPDPADPRGTATNQTAGQSQPAAPANQSALRAEPEASPSRETSALTLATVILTADLERSQGVPPTLLTSTGATHADLVVPRTGLAPGVARARVDSVEGARVWSGSMEIPGAEAADRRPRVRVPVSNLRPGDYLLSIEVPTDAVGGPRYYFRVRTK